MACNQEKSGIKIDQSKIKKILLTCIQGCKQMETPPFQTKTFVDPGELSVFEHALNESDTLGGVVDYIPYFTMEIVDQKEKRTEYHLNISEEKNRTGLIAPLSGIGALQVNQEMSEELRELIYGKMQTKRLTGVVISKHMVDSQYHVLVIHGIKPEVVMRIKSEDRLLTEAKSEKLDFAQYVTDQSTFERMQRGQVVDIQLAYQEQYDMGIPIRFANKITVQSIGDSIFEGYVIEISEKSLTMVWGVEPKDIISKTKREILAIPNIEALFVNYANPDAFRIGNRIKIWTTGMQEDSFPGQVQATKIVLLSDVM